MPSAALDARRRPVAAARAAVARRELQLAAEHQRVGQPARSADATQRVVVRFRVARTAADHWRAARTHAAARAAAVRLQAARAAVRLRAPQ